MRIVFLGSKKIGYECLKILINESQVDDTMSLVAVFTNERGHEIQKTASRYGISIYDDLDVLSSLDELDLLISVQYHKILKEHHIKAAKRAVNLHMAPLPEYRGCNQFSLAIIDGKKEFGTTIHEMDTGIDSGDILFEKRFSIPPNIWVDELYELTFEHSVTLFKSSLKALLSGDYHKISQEDRIQDYGSKICYRNEINDLKTISFNANKDEIIRRIRATTMPGFSGPRLKLDDKIFELNEIK